MRPTLFELIREILEEYTGLEYIHNYHILIKLLEHGSELIAYKITTVVFPEHLVDADDFDDEDFSDNQEFMEGPDEVDETLSVIYDDSEGDPGYAILIDCINYLCDVYSPLLSIAPSKDSLTEDDVEGRSRKEFIYIDDELYEIEELDEVDEYYLNNNLDDYEDGEE